MLPAVILSAKVTIDGLNKANAELSVYNKQWVKVAGTVEAAGVSVDKTHAKIDALRAATAVPIVQEVRIEVNDDALRGAAGTAGTAAASNAGGSTGADAGISAAAITKNMTQIRQWDRGHPNFFSSGGTTGASSADIQKLIQMLQVGRSGGRSSSSDNRDWNIDPGQLFTGHSSSASHGRFPAPWWARLAMGGGRLPGAGSLGSFAGFGAEHFALSAGGVLGSGVAATAGGGLLAAGAAGKIAVGGGSDMLVGAATIAATKSITEAQTKWNEAIKQYGYYSTQARTAQKAFNEEMAQAGPAGEAELKLGEHAKHLEKQFKDETAGARKKSAHLDSQGLNVAEAFVPKIAGAAEDNLTIINKDIKPLFAWLKGPEGMGVFDTLENKFKADLPTSIHAFTQAIEFILKTVADASKFTGGFTESVDKFFTKWNEPQNFSIWEEHIENLIEDFHLWMGFLKDIGHLLADIFSNDAHTGSAIVIALDEMINKADEWVNSTEGTEQLSNIFSIHKEEILALLKIIPPLVTIFRQVYMEVAPPLVHAATAVLVVIAQLLEKFEQTGPLAKWALGIAVILAKMGLLKPVMSWLWGQLGMVPEKMSAVEASNAAVADSNEVLAASNQALAASFAEVQAAAVASSEASVASSTARAGQQLAMDIPEAGAVAGSQLSLFATTPKNGAGAAAAEDAGKVAADAEKATKGGILAGIAGSNLAAVATTAGGVVGGYFAASFATKAVEGITGSDILEGQSLMTSLLHGFKNDSVAKIEAKAFAGRFKKEVKNALESDKAGPLKELGKVRAAGISSSTRKNLEQDAEILGRLKSGFVTDLPQIEKLVKKGSEHIAGAFAEGSPEWREATANNMAAAVEAIKEGEASGLITVEDGQKAIAKLLHQESVVTGNDPFGIAHGFTKSWEEAGGVNRKGIAGAMSDLGKMLPEVRVVTAQMMLQQVKHAEETGKLTKGSYDRMKSAVVADFGVMSLESGREAQALGVNVVNSFGEMNTLVAEALKEIGGNTNSVLKSLGAAALPEFNLKGKHLKKGTSAKDFKAMGGKQHGGIVVPGGGSGDTVPLTAMVEPGEVVHVLNRNASKKLSQLESLNKAVPRFQHGGTFSSGGQIILEPAAVGGTTQGKEPEIMADLKKFSAEMAQVVYVNSAYRTPQHSVEVGGYPDDPHTRGEAADIGLGAPTVASMLGVPESALSSVGLYRFDPTSPTEANHVELLAGGPQGSVISGVGMGSPEQVAAGIVTQKVKELMLAGPKGALGEIGNDAIKVATKAANEYLSEQGGVGGTGNFSEVTANQAVVAAGKTLLANGLNKIGTSGILGNAWQESGWNPGSVGSGGGGMLGFTAGEISWASLQAAAAAAGKNYESASYQMVFALEHISSGIISGLNSSASPAAATQFFMEEWEKPLVETENLPRRIEGAEKAYSMGLQKGGTVEHPLKEIENIVKGEGAKKPGPVVKAGNKIKPVLRTIEGYGIKGSKLERLAGLTTKEEMYGEYATEAEQLDKTVTAPAKEFEKLEKEGKATEHLVQGKFNGKTDGQWLNQKLGVLKTLRKELNLDETWVGGEKNRVVHILKGSKSQFNEVTKNIRHAEKHKREVEAKIREIQEQIKKYEKEIREIEQNQSSSTNQMNKELKELEHQLSKAEGAPKQTAAVHGEIQSLRGQIHAKKEAIAAAGGATHGSVKGLHEKINEDNKKVTGENKAIKDIEKDVTRYQRQEGALNEIIPVLESQREAVDATLSSVVGTGGQVGNKSFVGLATVQGLGGKGGGEIFTVERQLEAINEELHPHIEPVVESEQEAKEKPLKEIESRIALAGLTPGKEDDIAALMEEKAYDQNRLNEALGSNNIEEITQWAEALRGTEEQITGETGTNNSAEEKLAVQETLNEELRKNFLTLQAESPVMASMRSVSSIANAGAFAMGGMVAATVGENGAETVLLPNGSNVVSNAERRSVTAAASGRPHINFEKVEFHEAEGRVSGRANGQAFDTEAEVTKVTRKQATTATRSRTPGGATR